MKTDCVCVCVREREREREEDAAIQETPRTSTSKQNASTFDDEERRVANF